MSLCDPLQRLCRGKVLRLQIFEFRDALWHHDNSRETPEAEDVMGITSGARHAST